MYQPRTSTIAKPEYTPCFQALANITVDDVKNLLNVSTRGRTGFSIDQFYKEIVEVLNKIGHTNDRQQIGVEFYHLLGRTFWDALSRYNIRGKVIMKGIDVSQCTIHHLEEIETIKHVLKVC